MDSPTLLLVGLNADARAIALDAAQRAFPGAHVHEFSTVAEARQHSPAAKTELLLLGEPEPAALALATAATDKFKLPRWTVIVCGAGPADRAGVAAVVKPEDWNARLVAQVLTSAVRWHALHRENARLHGDLSTIGRRISHDLRTPLTAIYTACEGINELNGGPDGEHAVFTQSIATSTNELAQLVERVSFVVKALAEPAPRETVAMSDVVFDSLQRIEHAALRQGATVTQPKTWPQVAGVTAWLEVIWFNLLSNALQHATPAPKIEIGWSEASGQCTFWVNDSGRGVAPEKVGKLFYPFHELHRLNAPRGLGLSIVQQLVMLQGGACGYAPLDGGGAHFYFTLPAAKPTPPGS